MADFHRNRISHLDTRIEDLFILDEIENGKTETEARAAWNVCKCFIDKLRGEEVG